MSKVRDYMDNTKDKARHRVRRQEARSKKLSRLRKHNSNVYRWYKSGYHPALRSYNWWIPEEEYIINGHGHLKQYGCTSILKYSKRITSRTVRRRRNFEDEDYTLPNRSSYKRLFDLDSELW